MATMRDIREFFGMKLYCILEGHRKEDNFPLYTEIMNEFRKLNITVKKTGEWTVSKTEHGYNNAEIPVEWECSTCREAVTEETDYCPYCGSHNRGSKKIIIVINGKGGCGKDTLCEAAAEVYSVKNISSITPIKNMAEKIGWNGGKSDKDRKFLSDIKSLVTEYNDGTNAYLLEEVDKFVYSTKEVMFVHIREPEMIEHFKKTADRNTDIPIRTLLVKRDEKDKNVYGNRSDDEVENYNYDYTFYNNSEIKKAKEEFKVYLETILNERDE